MKIRIITFKALLLKMLFIALGMAAITAFIYAVIYLKNKENKSEIEFISKPHCYTYCSISPTQKAFAVLMY